MLYKCWFPDFQRVVQWLCRSMLLLREVLPEYLVVREIWVTGIMECFVLLLLFSKFQTIKNKTKDWKKIKQNVKSSHDLNPGIMPDFLKFLLNFSIPSRYSTISMHFLIIGEKQATGSIRTQGQRITQGVNTSSQGLWGHFRPRGIQSFGVSGPHWKKSSLGLNIKYTNTN